MAGGGWVPFKELSHVIRWALSHPEREAYFALEEALKKHRPDFTNLLENPAKNLAHRQRVQKAPQSGLAVPGLSGSPSLPEDFVEEALLLSDILELNEISSVELLLAGEQHTPRFPGLTRGLVAVLLYHDGRRCLLSSLRSLLQAREGVAWTLGLPPATHQLVTSFTDQLISDGLVTRILSLLDSLCVEGELAALEKGRAVGPAHHRRQIVELVLEQRACLADCLFVWAVQTPPGKDHTLQIIKHLKKVKVDCGKSVVAGDSGGQSSPDVTMVTVDMVTVSLCMTVMSCFNIGEESRDQSEESSLGNQYPLLSDATFLPSVHAELTNGDEWGCGWLCAVVKLAWAVLLRECSTHNAFAGVEEVQDDEGLLDEAVRGGVFAFLRRCVQTPNFHEEEYYLKKLHWMLTSMIINMPLKMRELRNYGDEVAREITSRGGVEGSLSQEHFFEDLMKLLGDLYRDDPHDLSLEFWWTGADTPRTNQRGISLHKFLGLCTDLLPAPMFSSLLYLLRGLSSSATTAYHCFEFLKSNSPSLGGGGASAAISLDHFFTSLRQYYLGLRREGAGLATPTGCAISPRELEGLVSVMKLIQTITRLDAGARVVMYESQQWLPVPSLFGLVGCPIPRELKAEVLLTLAAFAKSPDIATSMIHTLESVQVLNTVSGVGVAVGGALVQPQAKEGSIQVELEEIESQMEEYRLTRAFLVLLDSVTDVPLPPTLGAGHRVPGFQPYLDFVRDSVLLRFDSRGYQNTSEKWQVARLALEILKKLLDKHEISLDDFGNTSHDLGGGMSSLPISPGHSLLVHMFNDSHLLKKVLMIIDECGRILATPGGDGGVREGEGERESVAGAALLALQMVECALEKQDGFFSLIRQNNLSVMVTPLDQLLLGINPRSGLADHFINIASYMSLTWETPELALSAVNILVSSSHSVKVAREMAVAISNNKKAKLNIIHGFVEHLEWEGPDTPSDDPAESPTATVAGVHRQVQLGILRLLSDCVGKPPNIAHLLLGFEARRGKQISETTLQDPGVLESPRTVLHSLLSLVQHSSDPRNPIGCHYGNPKLSELCYKVIFQLCSHRDLSTPTLRYLRNNHDFFHAQLSAIPLDVARLRPAEDEEEEGEGEMGGARIMTSQQVSLLHQQAWLLKTVAIEMRVTAETQLRSHNQRLVDLLMSEKSTNWNPVLGHVTGNVMSELTEYQPELLSIPNEGQRKILVLLDLVTFEDLPLPPLQAEFEAAIQSCDTEDPSSGLTYTDVRQLHQMMMIEVNSLRGGVGASAQRHSLLQEVQSVLEVVVLRNSVLENRHGNNHLFQGWRQVVEISLHSLLGGGGSNEGRGGAEKKEREISVLFELIQGLLARVEGRGRGALSGEVFRVLLVLMSHLSFITTTAVTEDDDSLLTLIFSAPLQSILRDLLTAVQQTPGAMQLARAHLYGSLLYFLTVSRQQHSSDSSHHRGQTGWRLEWSEDSLAAGNLATIASFGEPLMEIVCRDASSGHDVTRMLSLSLLDAMFSIDRDGSWLRFIVSRGYLAKLAASLLWEDESLQKMLHPLPDTLRALYVHESRMALLSRLAQTPAGSRELLAANCISYIAQCHFIDLRPDHHDKHTSGLHGNVFDPSGTGFVPPVGDRYRQLLLPLLKLLLTMLTCPGAQRSEVKSQVTSLIGAHSDTFTSILKSHRGPVSVATLEELSLVTGVIGHSGVGQDWSTQDSTALGSGMVHIQRLMLALIPHYCDSQMWSGLVSEALRGEAEGTDVNPDPLVTLETKLKVLQICANIVDYCRVAMTMGGKEFSSPYCRIIFSPELMTSLSTNPSRDGPRAFHTSSSSPLTPSQAQSLGHLIKQLREVSGGYQVTLESSRQIQRKTNQPSSLSQDEVLRLVSLAASSLPLSHQQSLARRKLKKMLSLTKKEMDLHAYIAENLLYLLWRHLQFYLVHCKPVGGARALGVGGASFTRPTMRRIDEPAKVTAMETTFDLSSLSEGVSPGDLESLKMSIGRCLPSSLFQQLLDIEEGQEAGKRGQVSFIQALVHRVRKLVKLRAAPPTARPTLVT